MGFNHMSDKHEFRHGGHMHDDFDRGCNPHHNHMDHHGHMEHHDPMDRHEHMDRDFRGSSRERDFFFRRFPEREFEGSSEFPRPIVPIIIRPFR